MKWPQDFVLFCLSYDWCKWDFVILKVGIISVVNMAVLWTTHDIMRL